MRHLLISPSSCHFFHLSIWWGNVGGGNFASYCQSSNFSINKGNWVKQILIGLAKFFISNCIDEWIYSILCPINAPSYSSALAIGQTSSSPTGCRCSTPENENSLAYKRAKENDQYTPCHLHISFFDLLSHGLQLTENQYVYNQNQQKLYFIFSQNK